jgi:hypothetical protein
MGMSAQSARILRFFLLALCAATVVDARAAPTAQGVALNTNAGCSNGDLDLTLTGGGASRESWLATSSAGATLVQGEGATSLGSFSGTFSGFRVGPTGFLFAQPPNTLVGSYAYVGETPPAASNTAEFFVYYNCTTRRVLYSCFGAYGTCPQTAQDAAPLAVQAVPAVRPSVLALTLLGLASIGALVLRRRKA